MSINITKYTSTINTTAKKGRSIKYIVLHYTAGTSSKVGSAKNTAAYFMGGSAGGSADFIVDDGVIVQYNPDIKNRYCWAVGGSKYTKKYTSESAKYYDKCNNTNCISIEMCSRKTDPSTLNATDTDWYLTAATVNNAVELTKYLMQQYNIGIDNVIMHHHVTGKVCPNPWCVNSSRLTKWYEFKSRLTEAEEDEEMVETGTMTVNGKDIKIDKIVKDGTTYIKLRGLENAGFEVGYDTGTKNLTLANKKSELSISADSTNTNVKSVNIDGYNYCKLRDVTNALGKNVSVVNGKIVID